MCSLFYYKHPFITLYGIIFKIMNQDVRVFLFATWEENNKWMDFAANKRPILNSRPAIKRAAANLPKCSNVSIQIAPRDKILPGWGWSTQLSLEMHNESGILSKLFVLIKIWRRCCRGFQGHWAALLNA